ncbi:peptide/nickel transport system ATP-binding protein [Stella humosa]|uniref:Peptide/nickel transport system ATP-binding protein n=1 Tax=Stella humosa TaxID=94 RepID=A0A3N1MBI4_9PROT|nr:ABC transporter ATP-binding protein [Stella humosa]ROQ00988.1 peptide/nickel transport system ATP-binding protein [Stella humosa]BBK31355.1 ABC transporter ATP-binding protein [Stella humosa]
MTAPPIATDKPALEVRDLTVRFRQRHGEIAAVNGVSFGLAPGEVLGILGESGSGKSVTLRAIMRLLPPERTVIGGQVRIGGTDMLALAPGELDRARGKRVAMIFQEPMLALDPVFSVGEQIAETVVRHEGVGWADANRRALELFELVQIPSAKRRLAAYPHELSGGMRQRAMIALALSCRPQVLLADEPTTALDVTVQIQIVLLLRELQQALGMAVVFVTHDIGVAVEISDRLAVMYAGRFVENGTVEAVIDQPSHPYTLGLLNSTVHGSRRGLRLEPIPGSPPDLSALPGGCSFQPRCTRAIADCRVAVPDPVELGPDHTARCIRLG